jgi:ERCC4-type nuclease
MSLKILIDTREKNRWDFSFFGIDQEIKKLDTGDYMVDGINQLVFERKASTGEISINLGKKWKQFEAELERMSHFEKPYLICEFPIEHLDIFPAKSGIPKSQFNQLRMSGKFIKKRLFESCVKYNIEVLFFNSKEEAVEQVYEIIKQVAGRS